MDVGVPRPDYERFVELARTELDPRFSWQDYRTERGYPFIFGKLMRNGTVVRDRQTQHLAMRQCVGIDIFPLDGIPRRRLGRAAHKWAAKFCRLRLGAGIPSGWPKKGLALASHLVPRRFAIWLCERMGRHVAYEKSAIVANLGGAYGYARESVPREWFGDGAELPFEDMTACGPAEWDAYLKHVYGDYMQLPPEDKRRTDHDLTEVAIGPSFPSPTAGEGNAGASRRCESSAPAPARVLSSRRDTYF